MAEVAYCPMCDAEVPMDAAECPKCGEVFEPEVAVLEGLRDISTDREEPEEGRGRFLFYAGLAMVLAGGPGIALGSWLHDIMRIPVVGQAYDAFGWLNRFVAAIGLVVLVVGIVLLILALRLSRPVGEDYDLGVRPEDEPAP